MYEQIIWPEQWTLGSHHDNHDEESPVFLISVDGVHCCIKEPRHPTLSRDTHYYSHKFHQAAVNYELGISIYDNKLVWMNGPFPAGTPDVSIFRNAGLKALIPAGKRVIADRGYRGENAIISTPNPHDPPHLKKFKSRARARHESFNSRIKNFACLSERSRHRTSKHKVVFEAVCVICQYQLEMGSPLFET